MNTRNMYINTRYRLQLIEHINVNPRNKLTLNLSLYFIANRIPRSPHFRRVAYGYQRRFLKDPISALITSRRKVMETLFKRNRAYFYQHQDCSKKRKSPKEFSEKIAKVLIECR